MISYEMFSKVLTPLDPGDFDKVSRDYSNLTRAIARLPNGEHTIGPIKITVSGFGEPFKHPEICGSFISGADMIKALENVDLAFNKINKYATKLQLAERSQQTNVGKLKIK
tara:strand:+ start:1295 stop:1627 length:333 start_codon:yes stop_codon:yes gene_type:complete